VMYLMMWSVALWPANNPVIDDHILGALSMVVLGLTAAGDTWGLGARWSKAGLVHRFPILR
jgi:thiosulfate dehydrogenase (quinone) large subunit